MVQNLGMSALQFCKANLNHTEISFTARGYNNEFEEGANPILIRLSLESVVVIPCAPHLMQNIDEISYA